MPQRKNTTVKAHKPGAGQAALTEESLLVSVQGGQQLHMRRIYRSRQSLGLPVFMLHGDTENGGIFYNKHGKGLAPYLAWRGYDVYVPDLRGKGRSWPRIGAESQFGYHEVINQDIPALLEQIKRKRGDLPQFWLGHGVGGVWLMSYLARYQSQQAMPVGCIHFAVRRRMTVANWKRRWLVDRYWRKVGERLVKLNGYLPAKTLRLGTEDETAQSFKDSVTWSCDEPWLDPVDGFDYGQAIQHVSLPPALYLSASQSQILCHPQDVRLFMQSLGRHDGRMLILDSSGSGSTGFDQVTMLTSGRAVVEHFPQVADWMQQYEQKLSEDFFIS